MTKAIAFPKFRMLAMLLALGATGFALSACNTTAGVGKDVSATGNAVTDTAKDVQKKM
jgi:predicted small secreted protein